MDHVQNHSRTFQSIDNCSLKDAVCINGRLLDVKFGAVIEAEFGDSFPDAADGVPAREPGLRFTVTFIYPLAFRSDALKGGDWWVRRDLF